MLIRRYPSFPVVVLASCLPIFTLAGCNSIYHRTGEEMSTGIGPRLSSRISDARASAVAAATVIARSPDAPDLAGRTEPLSWDLSKSVASVHDVVDRLPAENDHSLNDLIATFDRADADLAAATDSVPNAHPSFVQAAASLKLAITHADAYLSDRTALAPQPASTLTASR